jgi:hypothetical protein
MLTNKMHFFKINVLIQFFLSSTCFEHLMFIIRKTILYMQPYMVYFPCWLALHNCISMHGKKNIKFANTQQAKQIYQYKNIKEKLYTSNAAICYNKTCRQKRLSPKHGQHNIQGSIYNIFSLMMSIRCSKHVEDKMK